MTGRQPNPRDVRRLQSLENDLKAQREAAEKLVAERNTLASRVRELEKELQDAQRIQAQDASADEAVFKQLERFFKKHKLDVPAERTFPGFLSALQTALDAERSRSDEAAKRIESLEKELASATRTLEDSLQQVRDLQKRFEAREAELQGQVSALTADLAAARKSIAELEKSGQAVEPLLAENRRLAAELDSVTGEISTLREAVKASKDDIAAARAEAESTVRAEMDKQIAKLTSQLATLQKRLDTATTQLKEQGKTPLLPAESVAGMLNELVGQFQTGFSGLQIRDGELSLKVGFGVAGESGGFVVPTTDSPPELRENLQEIRLRFDRGSFAPDQT